MTVILKKHTLSTLYNNVDVTKISSVVRSKTHQMVIKVGMNFGEYGKMLRHKTIQLSATDLLAMTKPLKEHSDSILHLIGLLEDAAIWAQRRSQFAQEHGEPTLPSIFSKVLSEESPVFIHGVHKGRMIRLEFYGPGLRGMTIDMDTRVAERRRGFAIRMNELIETFRDHLKDLETLNYTALMEGVTA